MHAPSPPPHPPRDADAIDVFGYALLGRWAGFVLRAPLRHKLLAATCFVAVMALALTALQIVPIRWRVEATLLAQRNPLMGALSNPGMNREWDTPSRGARESIIRRENLIAICKQIDFPARYLATRAPAVRARDWLRATLTGQERTPEELLEALADTLEDRMWVTATNEGTVHIGFVWSDPELAFQVVQAATQGFLEERYASEIRAVGETIAILESHDARIQRQIAAMIAEVEEKERALQIRSAPRRSTPRRAAPDEETTRLESTLAARQRALTDLEDFRQRRLAELQAQLLQQQGTYAPQHPALASTRQAIESFSTPSPQIQALRAEVSELERALARRGGRTGDAPDAVAVESELAAARLRLDSEDPRLEYERRQLENLLRQHEHLVERIDAARVEMDTAQAAFKYRYTVVTPPQIPKRPAKPYALIILFGGLMGGAGLAFLAAALADLRTGRVIERWQVEDGLDLPVLGEIRR